MPNILFVNYDSNSDHKLYWYIKTMTDSKSGRLIGQTSQLLPADALSIGLMTDGCQIKAYWNLFSKNYAYEVYSLPYSSNFAIPPDSSGEMIGAAAEGAAAGAVQQVQWKNNKKSNAEWVVYTNNNEVSGTVYAGTARDPSPLPTTRPLYLGWKVNAYSGMPLLNLVPPKGVAYQFILND